jgi:hypothetical protein
MPNPMIAPTEQQLGRRPNRSGPQGQLTYCHIGFLPPSQPWPLIAVNPGGARLSIAGTVFRTVN